MTLVSPSLSLPVFLSILGERALSKPWSNPRLGAGGEGQCLGRPLLQELNKGGKYLAGLAPPLYQPPAVSIPVGLEYCRVPGVQLCVSVSVFVRLSTRITVDKEGFEFVCVCVCWVILNVSLST
jgi:hypothetical protein